MLNIKKDFPWFKNNPEWTYMDSGATSLKPKSVIKAIVEYYEKYGTNPHNTDSSFTYKTHQIVEDVRHKLAVLFEATDDEVIFNSGATEGLNMVALGIEPHLKPGDEIILTYGEHASNILPWFNVATKTGAIVKYVGSKNQIPTLEDYQKLLNEKTKVVSFASGFNLTGATLNENEISSYIKKHYPKIFVCIDATQSVQHRPFSVQKTQCDFMVCSSHKMFGPTGVGMVYVKKSIQPIINPLRYGGGMNFSIEEQTYQLLDGHMKYEGGTQNIAGIIGWGAAIDYLNKIGYEKIMNHEIELANYAYQKLSKIKNLIIYNEGNNSPTIAFNYDGVFCQDFASYLGREKIIVRSGLSCAKLYCNLIDTKALIRCSLYLYNTKEDIDRLYNAISKFKKGDEIYVD